MQKAKRVKSKSEKLGFNIVFKHPSQNFKLVGGETQVVHKSVTNSSKKKVHKSVTNKLMSDTLRNQALHFCIIYVIKSFGKVFFQQ